MNEPPSRIRPIWLLGGAAVLVGLAACLVVTIVITAVLISFSNSIASNTTPTDQPVAQNPTAVVSPSAPTPLPPVNSPVSPTLSATTTQNLANLPPPDQTVRTYYQLVSQQRYDLSWPLLTDAFKQKFNCCAPNYNYSGYLDWWNSVNYVDFGTVSVVSESGAQAVVYAQLYYVMNTGARSGVDSDPYIELLYNSATNTWQFNDKRASP